MIVIDPTDKLRVNKESKKESIRDAYQAELKLPVTTALGTFNGGEESASAINGAISLSDFNSEEITIITDINNNEIKCNRGQAFSIAAAIGNVSRKLFYKKQSLFRAIDAAKASSEVDAVVW